MPKRREFSKPVSALIAGAAAALVAALLQGPLEPLDLKTRDMRMNFTLPEAGGNPDAVMILVTDESLEWMAAQQGVSWPWDREAFAFLFRACRRGGAKTILFDFFTLADAGEGEPDLVKELKVSPPVYLALPFKERGGGGALPDRYAIEVRNDGSVEVPERYEGVLPPRPGIAEAVAGGSDVSTPRDKDNLVRCYRLFSKFRGRYYPSFALAALMEREKVKTVRVADRRVVVGSLSIPVRPDGSLLIRYYKPGESFKQLAASRVIGGLQELEEKGKITTFDPEDVKGKIVIIGPAAAALFDRPATPVAEVMRGSELHAVVLSNILRGEFLREVPGGISLAAVLLLALAAALVTRYASAVGGGVATVALMAGYGALAVALFRGLWVVDLVPQEAAIVLAYGTSSMLNYLYEGRQRLRVKREFQRYLAPKVVEKILKNPDALSLEGERKELSIFFMDFAGFTTMSETVDPAELVRLISEYHNAAAEEIFRTEGTVDKYIGDAIMAFWNDPVDQPDHAERACRAAAGAQRRLRELAGEMRRRGLPEMHARIGINTGVATVGDMGAKGQVNYTVIGDEVNLASRLEGVNKEFGTEILVSEATWRAAGGRFEGRELALIRVKGKKQAVRIFELLGGKGTVPAERLEAARTFEQALADFRARRWDAAQGAFRALGGHAAEVYVGLCDRYRTEPPPPDWDGSYQMETK